MLHGTLNLQHTSHSNPTNPIHLGLTQSGPFFEAKTRTLQRHLRKAFPAGISFHFPTAPVRIVPAQYLEYDAASDEEAELPDTWGWNVRCGTYGSFTYEGLEIGLDMLAHVLKTQGPFDGVIGFSQGAMMAAMLTSLRASMG